MVREPGEEATVLSGHSGLIGTEEPPKDSKSRWVFSPLPPGYDSPPQPPSRFCKPQQNKNIINTPIKPSFLLSTKSSAKMKTFFI